ncbi:helix-turn-helix domain-containing protein [Mycetocola saprophilus]|uniref:helix-turn-helix domain-containing protein n=1 Tax=Mycetocola saprophilus TaxID=76636 RepID=UPI0004BE6AE2|nr:helix-turn-helix domain-containing protein [Mycetocola saprophilus]
MNESLITTGVAAERLGVSRQHIVDLCERGELPFTRVGKHRRIRPSDIERLKNSLTPDEERSLWLHEAVLGQLILDPPRVVGIARGNLRRWAGVHRDGGMSAGYLAQWQEILDHGIDATRGTLIGRDRRSIELRQNSPFSGVLTDSQRAQVLRNFTAYRAQPEEASVA